MDEITLSHQLDWTKVLNSMDDWIDKDKNKDDKSNKSWLNEKLEPEHGLKQTTNAQSMKFLNQHAQLDYTIFSNYNSNSNSNSHITTNNMFVNEEIHLAEQTMKRALTRKQNLEKKIDCTTIVT